jgi:hypothetical protein
MEVLALGANHFRTFQISGTHISIWMKYELLRWKRRYDVGSLDCKPNFLIQVCSFDFSGDPYSKFLGHDSVWSGRLLRVLTISEERTVVAPLLPPKLMRKFANDFVNVTCFGEMEASVGRLAPL